MSQGLTKTVRGGKTILNDVSLSILPGEFVAIVGGSGAGKTTLMDAISGVRPATGGTVLYNGRDYYASMALYRNVLGYVPQDDIIHTALPVRDTLRYAAQLRLPPDTSRAELDAAVDQTLAELGMTAQADTVVGALSGGQRKRSSIGVELLTQPRIFFLDEPTSGLDPATDAQMMRLMRHLADGGSTVVLTTHATKNVMLCDKIVFLARGGHLAFVGTPQRALEYFAADAFDEIYERLADEATPEEWADALPRLARLRADALRAGAARARARRSRRGAAPVARRVGQHRRPRAAGAAVLGPHPPAFADLHAESAEPGPPADAAGDHQRAGADPLPHDAFDLDVENPSASVSILFFLAFAAFQFGLFDGIQEIVKEIAIFRRERMVNLAILPIVLSTRPRSGPEPVRGAATPTRALQNEREECRADHAQFSRHHQRAGRLVHR